MRWWQGLILIGAGFVLAAGLMTGTKAKGSVYEVWPVPDSTMAQLDSAFRLAPTWTKAPTGQVEAGITPHHALVSPIIAAWFAGLKNQPAPATVVIIGPDHHNLGAGYMTTAATDWQTPDGVVRVNRRLVQGLIQHDDAVLDPALIRSEHGVYTAIPYVHRAWPKAQIVTIAIKGDLRSDRLQRLAHDLDLFLGSKDLVITTVDFSHYHPTLEALTEDQDSLSVIARGDAEAALSLPVDSPPAISLILRYEKIRGLKYQQLAHTTSAEFSGEPAAQSTTSYLSAYFALKK